MIFLIECVIACLLFTAALEILAARRMDRAFLDLLDRKDFAYITVKELCQAAGVNRSTFYLHYETMGDLLSESVEAIMSWTICSGTPGNSSGNSGTAPVRNCTSSRRNI